MAYNTLDMQVLRYTFSTMQLNLAKNWASKDITALLHSLAIAHHAHKYDFNFSTWINCRFEIVLRTIDFGKIVLFPFETFYASRNCRAILFVIIIEIFPLQNKFVDLHQKKKKKCSLKAREIRAHSILSHKWNYLCVLICMIL